MAARERMSRGGRRFKYPTNGPLGDLHRQEHIRDVVALRAGIHPEFFRPFDAFRTQTFASLSHSFDWATRVRSISLVCRYAISLTRNFAMFIEVVQAFAAPGRAVISITGLPELGSNFVPPLSVTTVNFDPPVPGRMPVGFFALRDARGPRSTLSDSSHIGKNLRVCSRVMQNSTTYSANGCVENRHRSSPFCFWIAFLRFDPMRVVFGAQRIVF